MCRVLFGKSRSMNALRGLCTPAAATGLGRRRQRLASLDLAGEFHYELAPIWGRITGGSAPAALKDSDGIPQWRAGRPRPCPFLSRK